MTVEVGSNQLVGTDPDRIIAAYRLTMAGTGREPGVPPLWDGHAAERIAAVLAEKL